MIIRSLVPALGGVFLSRFQGLFYRLSDIQFHCVIVQNSRQRTTSTLYSDFDLYPFKLNYLKAYRIGA